MGSMPPQNTVHSARTLYDLLNLFLFVRHDLLNLFFSFVTTFSIFPGNPSRSSARSLFVPKAWIDAPGSRRRILQLFSAIHHDVLVPSITIFLCQFSRHTFTTLLLQLSRQFFTMLLLQFSLPSITIFLCPEFGLTPRTAGIFSSTRERIRIFLSITWIDTPDCRILLVHSRTHQDLLVSSTWIDAPGLPASESSAPIRLFLQTIKLMDNCSSLVSNSSIFSVVKHVP